MIDSLTGFEIALAPGFRTDFRESLYRMIRALTKTGVTILSTIEVRETFTEFSVSSQAISFLSDDILRLRYVSGEGQLRRMMVVVKMRRSLHSIDMREFIITSRGIVVGDRVEGFFGLTAGDPWSPRREPGIEPDPSGVADGQP